MRNSSLEPLLASSGINQDRIKAQGLKGRQRHKEKKERVCENLLRLRKMKNYVVLPSGF